MDISRGNLDEKWIEINIRVPDFQQNMNYVLVNFVKPFVQKWKGQIRYWHFLRETSPETKQPEIRFRLFGLDSRMEKIKTELDEELKKYELENPKVYLSHIFGAHGKSDKEYIDEIDSFGQKGWSVFRKFLMDSSDTSLRFIEDEIIQAPEKPLQLYIERFFHLLMNQLGPDPMIKSVAMGPEIMNDTFTSLRLLYSWAQTHTQKES